MKKLFISFVVILSTAISAHAYQVLSSRELGKGDARNQNVVVKCTTEMGKLSKKCSGWQGWRDLRNPEKQFSDWQTAANECCRTMGLR